MAIPVILNTITTGFNLSKINENFTKLATALQDAVSRAGSNPNTMSADLDMNSNNVLNADFITTSHLIVNGYEIGEDIETKGDKGWTPYHELVADGDRLVFQLTDYIDGEGLKPTVNIGKYLTEGGYTEDISLGTNVIGPPGPLGPGGGDLLSDNNLSDLDNELLAFNNIKQAATSSYTGVVELATTAEATTGTDTTRAVTAAGVAAAIAQAIASLNAIPVGTVLDYTGSTAPSGYIFPYGQAISRTTYASYFALVGTTYGSGNGSSTFNVPDLRGRVVAGQDDMGGTSANRLTNVSGSVNGDTLGDTGGVETVTLVTANLPSHNHTVDPPSTNTSTVGDHGHPALYNPNDNFSVDPDGGIHLGGSGSTSSAWAGTPSETRGRGIGGGGSHNHTVNISSFSSGNTGSGSAVNNVQPTIILNKILYVGV